MSKSPEEMLESMLNNLKNNTGKNLEEWLQIAQKSTLTKHGEILKYLKSEYSVTHGYANLIAHKFLKSDSQSVGSEDDLINSQYAGNKAELRPIYEAIIEQANSFGSDVGISPKKAYVSLRRKKQFAIIQPSTKTRVDVGINLKGTEFSDRLEKSGSFNAMVSHRVRLSKKEEVDKELVDWLKQAYENS